jgi:hypothetical protein
MSSREQQRAAKSTEIRADRDKKETKRDKKGE